MSKFIVDIFSPDGEFQVFEIEKALDWLMHRDGILIRGTFTVKKMEE